jgi:hypothetical protein
MYSRPVLLLSAAFTTIGLAVSPMALAGGETTTVIQTVTTPPPPAETVTVETPAPPAPPAATQTVTVTTPAPSAPSPSTGSSTKSAPASKTKATHAKKHAKKHAVVHAKRQVAIATVKPVGGVQAGAGGTAPSPGGPDALLVSLLAGGGLALVTGGGLIARARRQGS